MNDDGSPMTSNEMKIAICTAGKVINRLNAGGQVLVTCRQGRNRSGIVAALALCEGPHKFTYNLAVNRIRSARGPGALRNDYFLHFLQKFSNRSKS